MMCKTFTEALSDSGFFYTFNNFLENLHLFGHLLKKLCIYYQRIYYSWFCGSHCILFQRKLTILVGKTTITAFSKSGYQQPDMVNMIDHDGRTIWFEVK